MATADPGYDPAISGSTPPVVFDGTGLTTTVPLTVKNGKSGSGIEVQVTSTITSGYSLLNSSGTTKGGLHLVATAGDEITGTVAGDITLTGDATKLLHVGALSGAAAVATFDLANSRLGIGTIAPGVALHVKQAVPTITSESTNTAQAGIFRAASNAASTTLSAFGSAAAGNQFGVAKASNCYLVFSGTSACGVGSGGAVDFLLGANDTEMLRFVSGGAITVKEATNIATGTTTGTKIGTATTQKIGFYNATPVVQQTRGATLTNSVTSGGTDDTIANYTDLTIYANDAAAIRNDIYQLARIVRQHDVALRALGLES